MVSRGGKVDYIDFVNSKDVASHMREVGYQSTGVEASYLVHRNLAVSLFEKFDAWKEIINAMPDEKLPIASGFWNNPDDPLFLHGFLREYMDAQRAQLELFVNDADSYDCISTAGSQWAEGLGSFASVDEAINFLKKLDMSDEEGEIILVKDGKDASGIPHLILRPDLAPLCVNDTGGLSRRLREIDAAFDAMQLHFPHPFEPGDILVECRGPWLEASTEPFVVDESRLTYPDYLDYEYFRGEIGCTR